MSEHDIAALQWAWCRTPTGSDSRCQEFIRCGFVAQTETELTAPGHVVSNTGGTVRCAEANVVCVFVLNHDITPNEPRLTR
jgi:hypothetical protein